GGRPDLAGNDLAQVEAATLLLVGSLDLPMIQRNKAALEKLTRAHRREINVVPGATHLFEEKGALEEVALPANEWVMRYLGAAGNRDEHQHTNPRPRNIPRIPR